MNRDISGMHRSAADRTTPPKGRPQMCWHDAAGTSRVAVARSGVWHGALCLDHRLTVCVWSGVASGNSNRLSRLLKHHVESRESFVFESRQVGASPVDFGRKIKIANEGDDYVAPS
jgi:hypothetical protein